MRERAFSGDIDLAYALDLLQRINNVVVDGVRLKDFTVLGGYNIWHSYQSNLLVGHCQSFSETRGKTTQAAAGGRGEVYLAGVAALLGFFISVLAIARASFLKVPVLVFTPDKLSDSSGQHDFRFDTIYQFLNSEHIPYSQLLHTVFGKRLLRNVWKRRNFPIYLEALSVPYLIGRKLRLLKAPQKLSRTADLGAFSEEEIPFVRATVNFYLAQIPRTLFRIRLLSWLFRRLSFRYILAIDDIRYLFELTLAAKFAGVPVLAFQHGHVSKYHLGALRAELSGLIPYPDRFYVWSEYWKKEYLRLGSIFPEETIEIGGVGKARLPVPTKRSHGGPITILFPYETAGPRQETREYFDTILSCPNTRVFFKLRPDLSTSSQRQEYGIDRYESERFSVGVFGEKELEDVDIVAGTYSTYLYHMIAYRKPIALIKTSSDFGEGLIKNSLADELDRREPGLCEKIVRLANTSEATLKAREKKLLGEKDILLSDTLRRILAPISK